ncbi:AIR synthase family protein [Chloroflexota bacterium]
MENKFLPVGKLPVDLLESLLVSAAPQDDRVLVGPGIGLDCAIIDAGATLFALKSDPITFATEEIGWYAVQVNANDIATTGATPRWMLVTMLLPEGQTTPELVEDINEQLRAACTEIGVSIIGGHTEITYGLERPILIATMIGEVHRAALITPRGAQPGDRLLLTKGVPIEATAILAGEFAKKLGDISNLSNPLSQDELAEAKAFLYRPGISVLRDARIATQAGQVNAMHDPTEGGLYAALWELAQASGCSLQVDLSQVYIPPLSQRICQILDLDPFGAIASGALLMAVPAQHVEKICQALGKSEILCQQIGKVLAPTELAGDNNQRPEVWHVGGRKLQRLPRPGRDEIAKLYD